MNKDLDKWYVRRLSLNSDGYTSQGYYYGQGTPLYECFNEKEYVTFRADDRSHAIKQLVDHMAPHQITLAKPC